MELIELRVSNDAKDDGDELRRRIDEDGYVFFKQLQDPAKLQELRREMLTVMQQGGWIVAGTDPVDGIANIDARCTEGDVEYTDVYHEVYKLESLHRSAHWPEVTSMIERIAGRPIMPHPQKIARLWFPKYTDHTTPTHQDFVHFQGNFQTYTAWAPVGDCPRELGGLAVLKGSHKVERVLDHHFSLGAGSLIVRTEDFPELPNVWHTTDYEIGDTLIFPALTIHQALPNRTEDRLRVSLDNRYQAVGDPIAEHMLEPHLNIFNKMTWEKVYEKWQSDELQYYWKDYDNPVIERDYSYLDKGFDEAVQLAQGGNEHALHYLRRFIRRDPASEQAKTVISLFGDA